MESCGGCKVVQNRGYGVFLSVIGVYLLNLWLEMDYGFWGAMTPVFAGALMDRRDNRDRNRLYVLMLCVGLLAVSMRYGGIQYWSFMAVPLLLLYSGRRGKWRMKYFFYVFYPAHLAILQIILWLKQGAVL